MFIYNASNLPAKSKKSYTDRKSRWKQNYGITEDRFLTMLNEQQGVCAICKKPEFKRLLSVDHCHSTGQIRGLLCSKCNLGIGNLEDSTGSLESAIDYLLKAKASAKEA